MNFELDAGHIVWVDFDPRPCVVVSSRHYLRAFPTLVSVVPITSRNRGWENHVPVEPGSVLPQPSWVMTEQIRTVSRERVVRLNGRVSDACFRDLLWWVRAFIADPVRV